MLASTHEDLHGERLEKAELEELLAGMSTPRLVYLDHDPRRPPTARICNDRLLEMEDGEWAIVSDVEVLDEEAFGRTRGFSISFNRTPVARGTDDPGLIVSFNPRYLERAQLKQVLSEFGRLDREAVLVERSEKSLTGLLLIWFIVSQGFWEELGADVYRLAKSILLATFSGEMQAEVAVDIKTPDSEPQVVLMVGRDGAVEATVETEALIAAARELAPGNEIVRVVALIDEEGTAAIDHAVDAAGVTLRPASDN